MNNFGGNWTKHKIEILVEYAQSYLTIMNIYADKNNWKLLYYDGFAGSGLILKEDNEEDAIIGAARRIIEISQPRSFDEYYFVEKDEDNFNNLELHTKKAFPNKLIHTVMEDCNNKLSSMSNFLRKKGNKHKVLAYIDPCGMQVKWKSLEILRDLPIDMWILIPTGMGVNRLLRRDGRISEAWVAKLEEFLGLSEKEILEHFYTKTQVLTLFGEETVINKEANAIDKSIKLYKERLSNLFKFVSEPYPLKNSMNNTLYHFIMVSNNKSAVDIADDIIRKYKNLS
jgi:three-Cys-motif partner protein